jgi:lipoate-protein ligase A
MASVRSEVANIASLLPGIADIHQFIEKMLAWLMDFYPDSRSYEMKADEVAAIQELAESRYKIWQWNFGYSPAYSFQVDIQVLSSDMPIEIKVGNGKIVQIEVPPEAGNTLLYATLSNLIGILHKKEEIDTFVQNNRHSLELAGVNTVTFGETFFK